MVITDEQEGDSMSMDGRYGVPAMLRHLAQSIEDGAIPVRYINVHYIEPDAEDIADGDDPDDRTIMISIATQKEYVPIPTAFYEAAE
jgi:hypothetical protein